MISYKKQKYSDIRTPMTDEVFVQLVQETLKVNGVEVKEEVARRVLLSVFTSMAYYLYEEPTRYIDFKKMVLYRDVNLNNLLVLEAKEGENAQSIMDSYKNGGAYSEELERLVKSFIEGILEYSTAKEVEVTSTINKIKSSKESICNNSNSKEKK